MCIQIADDDEQFWKLFFLYIAKLQPSSRSLRFRYESKTNLSNMKKKNENKI